MLVSFNCFASTKIMVVPKVFESVNPNKITSVLKKNVAEKVKFVFVLI